MGKAAIFLADGFEEIEALAVVDICRRCDIEIEMVSIMEGTQVKGSHGIAVEADKVFSQAGFDSYDMLILPGGMPGTKTLDPYGTDPGILRVWEVHCGHMCGPQHFWAYGYFKGQKGVFLSQL